MPRIRLRPNSPEFDDPQDGVSRTSAPSKQAPRPCDAPGCTAAGAHRAPKDRNLKEYYYFCLEHVQDYNKTWDYFAGLNDDQIQAHILHSLYGDRPTRRYDIDGRLQDALEEKIRDLLGGEPKRSGARDKTHTPTPPQTPEAQALARMGLTAPVTLEEIRLRYRELVRIHHPDRTGGDKTSEEVLKSVTMAYTILRQAYEKAGV